MKILWLASWYPSKVDPFNGDFVQRQARALSLYVPVTVIHTVKDVASMFEKYPHTEITEKDNLTEVIVYYTISSGPISLVNKMKSTLLYRKYFRETVLRWLRKNGRPDVVHLHIPYKAGLVALWLKRHLDLPYFVTEHWAGYTRNNPDSYFNRPLAFRRLLEKIFGSAESVVVLTEDMRRTLKEIFRIHKTVQISNVVNTELFLYKAQPTKSKIRFIHVSSMGFQKNPEGILEVLERLNESEKNWEIVMVGPAPKELMESSAACNLGDQITWIGEIPYDQVAVEMLKANALVMFSRFETQGCVILESLCCGRPVVTTSVGGISEFINERNGLLVENEDHQGLLNALLLLIRNRDRFNSKEIATEAAERYAYSTIGKQMIDYYREILVDVT